MLGRSSVQFLAVCASATLTMACRSGVPARRSGVLAATVDSALRTSRQVVCNAIPSVPRPAVWSPRPDATSKPETRCSTSMSHRAATSLRGVGRGMSPIQLAPGLSGRWPCQTPDCTDPRRFARRQAASKALVSGARLTISSTRTWTLTRRNYPWFRTFIRVPEPDPRRVRSGTTYLRPFAGSRCDQACQAKRTA